MLCAAPGLLATSARSQEAPIAAVADYERSSGGRLGYYAENLLTGRKLAWRADQRFVMCSTFKASLAALILRRVDRRKDRLEDRIYFKASDVPDWHAPVARANLPRGWLSVREMCEAAVEQSDNTCANQLLARIGGPSAMTAFWRSIGDATSRLDAAELELNRTPPGRVENTTTPQAMADTLKKLVLGPVLSESSRHTFTSWLVGSKTGGNRLRAGLPGSWVTGDKTGTNGKDAVGDIAVTWPRSDMPIVIAAYTRGGSPSQQQFEVVFKAIGRSVAENLGSPERVGRRGVTS
ncbi:MAG: class A beta-lactamase [Caulobacteraceae bacterium]